MATTELVTALDTLDTFIRKNEGRISDAAPAGVKVELITRSLLAVIRRDPAVAACTPKSLINCLEDILMTGLEVGKGVLAKAYVVPRNNKVSKKGEPDKWEKTACFEIGYKGYKELVRRSGMGRLMMEEVREGDEFEDLGEYQLPKFKRSNDPLRFQKKLTWVFAAYVPFDGTFPIVKVWSRERCIAHRNQFAKGYKGSKGDFWHEDHSGFPVMCMKCPVLELGNRGDLPLSPNVMSVMERVDGLRTVQPLTTAPQQALPTPDQPIAHGIEDQTPIEADDTPADIDWTWFADHLGTVMTEKPLDDLCNELMAQHPHQKQEIFDACNKHRELIREQAK